MRREGGGIWWGWLHVVREREKGVVKKSAEGDIYAGMEG